MISYDAWMKGMRMMIVINTSLVVMIFGVVMNMHYQYKETDTTPQKLDSPGPRATIEKGNVMTNRYRWQCELVRVVDGDTLEAWIDLDFGVKLSAKLRLQGIDTPEIHTVKQNTEEYAKGMKAKEFVEERFRLQGKKFYIETSGKRPGKYGRFVVNVLMPSGDYLDALLLKAGHAVKKEY